MNKWIHNTLSSLTLSYQTIFYDCPWLKILFLIIFWVSQNSHLLKFTEFSVELNSIEKRDLYLPFLPSWEPPTVSGPPMPELTCLIICTYQFVTVNPSSKTNKDHFPCHSCTKTNKQTNTSPPWENKTECTAMAESYTEKKKKKGKRDFKCFEMVIKTVFRR